MTETRVEKKERTRRAILDAALELTAESGLSAVSLRQIAKEVGIVPTAFYRHFASLDELGLALVDDSFVSLRALIRDVRQGDPAPTEIIERSVAALIEHVHDHRTHFAFLTRERFSGPAAVRRAVQHELDGFEAELVVDLARLARAWSHEDLQTLANLIVGAMVNTAYDLLEAHDDPVSVQRIHHRAEQQLRMVVIGALQWRSRGSDGT